MEKQSVLVVLVASMVRTYMLTGVKALECDQHTLGRFSLILEAITFLISYRSSGTLSMYADASTLRTLVILSF